jgi:phosphopantothenoylcysteine decarboxylase/phosphopantothenate--cysteine ligase
VRYISNYSTGTFGYLIAEEARDRGYKVCLVSGPVSIRQPSGVEFVKVETADQMKKEVFYRAGTIDCLIMAAAVADFRSANRADQKIKKKERLLLELEKTPDILRELKTEKRPVKIGFALETGEAKTNGYRKLREKDLDMIIVNARTAFNDPFGKGKKDYLIIGRRGETEEYKNLEKPKMAVKIIEKVGALLK